MSMPLEMNVKIGSMGEIFPAEHGVICLEPEIPSATL